MLKLQLDPVSFTSFFLSGLIIVFLMLYGYDVLVPFALLSMSVMFFWLMGRKLGHDETLDSGEARNIFGSSLMAVVVILVANFIGVRMYIAPDIASLVVIDALLLAVLAAITEELFFRGALLKFFMWKLHKAPFIAIFLSAGIFGVFHNKVYGANPEALLIMVAVGTILGFVAWRTNRLSPVILAHVINNVLAVMGGFL